MASKLKHTWLAGFVSVTRRGKEVWIVTACKPWNGTKLLKYWKFGVLVMSTSIKPRLRSYKRKPHYYL